MRNKIFSDETVRGKVTKILTAVAFLVGFCAPPYALHFGISSALADIENIYATA